MMQRTLVLVFVLLCLPALLVAETISVDGRVLGPDGEAAAGAEIRLERVGTTFERARLRLEHLSAGPEPTQTLRSGKDGRFVVAVPEPGMWKIVVAKKGFLSQECRLTPLVERSSLPDVTLEKEKRLKIQLRDADGNPRAGAIGLFSRQRGTWINQLRLTQAGDDGQADLPVGANEKIELEVLAEDHPLAAWTVEDESSINLDLAPGAPVELRIQNAKGEPIQDAILFQGTSLLPLGLSDEAGHASLWRQSRAPAEVRLLTADGWHGTVDLEALGTKKTPLKVRLEAPRVASGTVLDVSNQDAVPDALVWAVRGEFVFTDSQGRYALPSGVPVSRIRARAAGYQDGVTGWVEGVDWAPIGLTPVAEVSGTVVDGEGNALPGIRIELHLAPQGANFSRAAIAVSRREWHGTTNQRGAFRVPGLPAELGYQLRFSGAGYAPKMVGVPPLEALEKRGGLEVMMKPGRHAFGWVVDEDEIPVVGAKVRLQPAQSSTDLAALRMMSFATMADPDADSVHTDREGRFDISDLASGRYDLAVNAVGYAAMRVPGLKLAEAEKEADLGVLMLIEGVQIQGRVTDKEGKAIAGARIAFDLAAGSLTRRSLDSQREILSDQEGGFSLEDLTPEQPLVMVVHHPEYAAAVLKDLRPPLEENLQVVLSAKGRVRGRVVDGQGDALAKVQIRAISNRSFPISIHSPYRDPVQSDAKGYFTVEGLEPGRLSVIASLKGYQQQSRHELKLEAGATLDLNLVLQEGSTVIGSITDSDGNAVPEARVLFRKASPEVSEFDYSVASATSDPLGAYRLEGAPIGSTQVTVRAHNEMELEKLVELRPGENRLDLVVEKGYEISGQIVTLDGTPIEGANFSAVLERGSSYRSFASMDGKVSGVGGIFTLTGLNAGKYRVVASHPEFAAAESEVLDVTSNIDGVLIQMSHGATISGRILGLEFDQLSALQIMVMGESGGTRLGKVDFSAEYSVEHLAPGTWSVMAQIPGSSLNKSLQVEITESDLLIEKDIEFTGDLTITGRVLEAGEPAAGMRIFVNSESGHSNIETGSDGRFRVEGLEAGTHHLVVSGDLGIHHQEQLELVTDRDLLIELPEGRLVGTVRRNDDGSPISGAQISLERMPGEGEDPSQQIQFTRYGRSRSDGEGRFTIPRIKDGVWRLVASRSGFAPADMQVQVLGGSSPPIEISMTPSEGVSFELVSASGSIPSTVQVSIYRPSGRLITTTSHHVINGRVSVNTLPEGPSTLVLLAADSALALLAVQKPGDQGQVILTPGGHLRVHIPELEQVPQVPIKITGPGGESAITTLGTQLSLGQSILHHGHSSFRSLKPGLWTYSATHGDQTWTGQAEVKANDITESSP